MSSFYIYNVSGLVKGIGLMVMCTVLLVTCVLVYIYYVSCQSWTKSFNKFPCTSVKLIKPSLLEVSQYQYKLILKFR